MNRIINNRRGMSNSPLMSAVLLEGHNGTIKITKEEWEEIGKEIFGNNDNSSTLIKTKKPVDNRRFLNPPRNAIERLEV